MNSDFSKLRQKQAENLAQDTTSISRSEPGQKFESVEELLRYDSAQNPVPEGVAQRLSESLLTEPPPNKSWWKRLFG